jgi:hypothetical protein
MCYTETRKVILLRLKLLLHIDHPNIMQCIDFWVSRDKTELTYISEIVIKGSLKL